MRMYQILYSCLIEFSFNDLANRLIRTFLGTGDFSQDSHPNICSARPHVVDKGSPLGVGVGRKALTRTIISSVSGEFNTSCIQRYCMQNFKRVSLLSIPNSPYLSSGCEMALLWLILCVLS